MRDKPMRDKSPWAGEHGRCMHASLIDTHTAQRHPSQRSLRMPCTVRLLALATHSDNTQPNEGRPRRTRNMSDIVVTLLTSHAWSPWLNALTACYGGSGATDDRGVGQQSEVIAVFEAAMCIVGQQRHQTVNEARPQRTENMRAIVVTLLTSHDWRGWLNAPACCPWRKRRD